MQIKVYAIQMNQFTIKIKQVFYITNRINTNELYNTDEIHTMQWKVI